MKERTLQTRAEETKKAYDSLKEAASTLEAGLGGQAIQWPRQEFRVRANTSRREMDNAQRKLGSDFKIETPRDAIDSSGQVLTADALTVIEERVKREWAKGSSYDDRVKMRPGDLRRETPDGKNLIKHLRGIWKLDRLRVSASYFDPKELDIANRAIRQQATGNHWHPTAWYKTLASIREKLNMGSGGQLIDPRTFEALFPDPSDLGQHKVGQIIPVDRFRGEEFDLSRVRGRVHILRYNQPACSIAAVWDVTDEQPLSSYGYPHITLQHGYDSQSLNSTRVVLMLEQALTPID